MRFSSSDLRRWCRVLHRDLSYLFAGMVLIYAISGLYMNHRDTINPHYTVTSNEVQLDLEPTQRELERADVEALMERVGVEERYTKHYYPHPTQLKVFLKGGSTLEVDMTSGRALYEQLRRRPLVSAMTTMHYNPNRWWTWFADIFAVALILITLTGLVMVKGSRGLWGRGGVELLVGIVLPILILLLC